MQSYNKAAFISTLIGWIVSNIVYNLVYLIISGKPELTFWIVVFGVVSLLYSLVANLLYVQESQVWAITRAWIKNAYFANSRLKFALLFAGFGTVVFTIPVGVILYTFFTDYHHMLFFIEAAVNGFAYGIAFHTIWKPIPKI